MAGKAYPAGSYVIKTAQAFRPHVMDMFEPQDHPNDFRYPGGPPNPPYDVTGWTLAMQMGVKFDRILDGIDGALPLTKINGLLPPPPAAHRARRLSWPSARPRPRTAPTRDARRTRQRGPPPARQLRLSMVP